MGPEEFLKKSTRAFEIALGAVVAILALACLGLSALGLYFTSVDASANKSHLIVSIGAGAIGAALLLFAVRLLRGKGRHGGPELIPSWGLRLGGVISIFLAIPICVVVGRRSFLDVSPFVAFAVACFALASRRERLDRSDVPAPYSDG